MILVESRTLYVCLKDFCFAHEEKRLKIILIVRAEKYNFTAELS